MYHSQWSSFAYQREYAIKQTYPERWVMDVWGGFWCKNRDNRNSDDLLVCCAQTFGLASQIQADLLFLLIFYLFRLHFSIWICPNTSCVLGQLREIISSKRHFFLCTNKQKVSESKQNLWIMNQLTGSFTFFALARGRLDTGITGLNRPGVKGLNGPSALAAPQIWRKRGVPKPEWSPYPRWQRGHPGLRRRQLPQRTQYGRGGCSGLRPSWPPSVDMLEIFNNIAPNLQKTTVTYNFLDVLMYVFFLSFTKKNFCVVNKQENRKKPQKTNNEISNEQKGILPIWIEEGKQFLWLFWFSLLFLSFFFCECFLLFFLWTNRCNSCFLKIWYNVVEDLQHICWRGASWAKGLNSQLCHVGFLGGSTTPVKRGRLKP